ncbi:hypothetical protein [Pseudorhodoplanes sp.]|uniref:hypothetical protein n=1 Tax=Pseudorhodoplanes sp. TaxID=1934341 RepID=UPI0039194C77
MLPDLRIVIAAVLSTFILSMGAGFYVSSRLMPEPSKRPEALAAFEDTPVNRIALSWPEPTRQPEPSEALALDFAVTARVSRNPVRDVTDEPAAAAPSRTAEPVRSTARDLPAPATAKQIPEPRPKPDMELVPVPGTELPGAARPSAPPSSAVLPIAPPDPDPAPEPDIRIAVVYPPLELPPDLQAPVSPAVSVAPEKDSPPVTGSIVEQTTRTDPLPDTEAPIVSAPEAPAATQPAAALSEPAPSAPEPSPPAPAEFQIASRPEGAEAALPAKPAAIPMPKPAPTIRAKKAAPKKAAPRPKVARRAARPAPAPAQPPLLFWNIFAQPPVRN